MHSLTGSAQLSCGSKRLRELRSLISGVVSREATRTTHASRPVKFSGATGREEGFAQRRRIAWVLMSSILTLSPLTASADILSSVNKVRTRGCPGRPGGQLPVRESSRLDAVAKQLARGVDLRRAQKAAGYYA